MHGVRWLHLAALVGYMCVYMPVRRGTWRLEAGTVLYEGNKGRSMTMTGSAEGEKKYPGKECKDDGRERESLLGKAFVGVASPPDVLPSWSCFSARAFASKACFKHNHLLFSCSPSDFTYSCVWSPFSLVCSPSSAVHPPRYR